ncbi:MAG TPA: FKBP-type peptidyl-prolyl cis-trans isomerase [Ktedonobacteraceae bacterium]|nr:FKBP-type peptidyl-prolyl cis-trans isomerase [Ktedonobacteraceae bacterium]
MTQTAKGQNKDQKDAVQRRNRPGQRQQERLMRQARRQKRQRIIISIVTIVLLAGAIGFGIWQYQLYATAQATTTTRLNNQHATATARAAITPTPSAGPATPPPVTAAPVKLPDGLQYIDIKQGTGPAAQTGSNVSVQYTGWLQSNGKKFDSSYDHGGQPFQVTIGQQQVIPGWEEGLVGMKAGGTRRLIIPAALGYGAQGQPPTIPANATLIFDITVVSVQ